MLSRLGCVWVLRSTSLLVIFVMFDFISLIRGSVGCVYMYAFFLVFQLQIARSLLFIFLVLSFYQ